MIDDDAELNETADLREARARPSREVAGIGRVLLWSGGSVWIGRRAGLARRHAHHAIQIALALRGRFAFDDGAGSAWREHAGAIVRPHRPHRFDGRGSDVAMLFVEPETRLGRALLQRCEAAAVTPLDAAQVEAMADPLRQDFDAGASDAALVADACRALARLAPDEARATSDRLDRRIERAVAWMRERLSGPISLADAAAQVHLSPSRFRHLFVAETGTSLRAYLLWARVEAAMAAGMAGDSWTAAAQDAGFADSAHFSRTCRRMFGIAPAMLQRSSAGSNRSG